MRETPLLWLIIRKNCLDTPCKGNTKKYLRIYMLVAPTSQQVVAVLGGASGNEELKRRILFLPSLSGSFPSASQFSVCFLCLHRFACLYLFAVALCYLLYICSLSLCSFFNRGKCLSTPLLLTRALCPNC